MAQKTHALIGSVLDLAVLDDATAEAGPGDRLDDAVAAAIVESGTHDELSAAHGHDSRLRPGRRRAGASGIV
ncbi:hypothetical protein [Kibdelosporangium phytohabitans]|uniref:hypothetical protein n=1 Tax=Kibdelosporangium phytohabitans TaxID=860235 RepID=UPI0012FB5924|nr:hypothetical protein [Kibdelosporangium phytohabitans]MBE1463391.1 hypothetical protein [Kibdelosporangium phytohabitans]